MKNILFKYFILLFQKTSIMVGGQAVINGVMMRVPGAYATAVRLKTGEIKVQYNRYIAKVEKYKVQNIPVVRGFIHLIDSMKIGYKTLDWSAETSEESTEKSNIFIEKTLSVVSVVFVITLFMGIPYYLAELGLANISSNNIIFNLVAGIFRLIIFIIYLVLLSQLKEIKKLFQYHGAEHKVVFNFESGEKLSIENAKTFSTKHPRCGTSFMFIIMIVTIITYSFIDTFIANIFKINFNIFNRILIHLLFLPMVAGFGYETLKFLSKMQKYFLFRMLSQPGLWLQNITTKEPNNEQLAVSIKALESAFQNNMSNYEGKKHIADAIG